MLYVDNNSDIELMQQRLTLNMMAGTGVYLLVWIIAKMLGSWPSLAPTKNSLCDRVSQDGDPQ